MSLYYDDVVLKNQLIRGMPAFDLERVETMELYRPLFGTQNRWTFLVDGTARAGIEASLVSLVAPGDRVLVIRFGRFGLLLTEILERIGEVVAAVDAPWGDIVPLEAVAAAIERHAPSVIATVHGDPSTTMAQPLDGLGALAHAAGALLYIDATAAIGGMEIAADRWQADVITGGLQKCLGGPSGSAPITISDAAAERIFARRHVEQGLQRADIEDGTARRIASNYFDLAMVMDYWSEKRLTIIPRRRRCSMERPSAPVWCSGRASPPSSDGTRRQAAR